MKKKSTKQNIFCKTDPRRGISLIVLVITIIIMIILAAAVILSLSGNGIISKANEAVDANTLASARNVLQIARAEWELMSDAERRASPYNNSYAAYARAKLDAAGLTSIEIDNNGDIVTEAVLPEVPEGFTASIFDGEKTVAGGFVIYGTDAVTLETKTQAQAQELYDQFVWIPVNGALTRYDWDNRDYNFVENDPPYDEEYFDQDYYIESIPTNITNSINQHGGFYVARYETSCTIEMITETWYDDDENPIEEECEGEFYHTTKGKELYFYNGNRLRLTDYVATAYIDSNSVIGHNLFGAEYDAMLKFIETEKNVLNGTDWGNTGEIQASGSNDAWKAKNIYDVSGNAKEITMERYLLYTGGSLEHGPAIRGLSNNPARRDFWDNESGLEITSEEGVGLRMALCLK